MCAESPFSSIGQCPDSVEKWDAYSLKRRYKYESSRFIAHYAVRAVAAPIQDDTAAESAESGEAGDHGCDFIILSLALLASSIALSSRVRNVVHGTSTINCSTNNLTPMGAEEGRVLERCPLSLHPLPLLDNQPSTLRPSDCVTSMIRKCCPLHHHYLSLFLSLAGSPRIAFPTRNLSLLVRTDPPLPSSSLPQPPPSQGDVFNPGADTRLQPWQLELVMGRKHGPVALPLPLPLAPLRPSIRCVPFTALLRAENCRSPLSMEGVEMLPNTPCPNLVRGMEEKAITELCSTRYLRLASN